MFKKIAIILGVLVVVVAVGMYYLAQNAGTIVQGIIEKEGSRVTQVAVALEAVDISLTDLKAGLRGLTVANPEGFKTDYAVSLGAISVKLAKDWPPNTVVIEEVVVNDPEVTYEIGANGSNIAAIQKNVENFMQVMGGGRASSSAPSSGEQDGDGAAGPKVVINDLYIKGGKVNVSATLMQGKSLTAPLPEIHLEDIGKDSGGASPAEVVDQVIAAITASSGSAARSVDLSQLGLADISGKAAEMGKAATDAATKALEGATEGTSDAAKDAVEGASDALKGLFGN